MFRALATSVAAALLALGSGAPPHARAGGATARLVVSANVVRTVAVTVTAAAAGESGLEVRTSAGEVWSGTLAEAARTPGIGVATYAPDPRYLVVTVHADAPLAAAARRAR